MEIRGKVALVTGGARRVGKAIAVELAREGASIVLAYHRSAEAARQTVGEIQAMGVAAVAIQVDQSHPEEVERLFDQTLAALGRLDILVNSAAMFLRKPFLDLTPADWETALRTNLDGPFWCTQRAGRIMTAAGGGVIVNISDSASIKPWPSYGPHSVAKAGVNMLTRVAALALAPTVRVNAVVPGPVAMPEDWTQDRWLTLGRRMPLGHTGTPEDIARAVAFLVREDFITGTILVVDGGDTLR